MESIAVLTNLLVREVRACQTGKPSRQAITAAFAEYQQQRLGRAQQVCDFSGFVTRLQAWDGWALKLAACYLPLVQSDDALAQQIAPIISAGPKLDFIPMTRYPRHAVPWADEVGQQSFRKWTAMFRKVVSSALGASVALYLIVFAVKLKGSAVLANE